MIQVCKKVNAKRKPFESSKGRVTSDMKDVSGGGTGRGRGRGAGKSRGGAGAGAGAAAKPKNEKWKNKSNDFRNAMKAARMIAKAEKDGVDIRTLDLPSAAPSGPDPSLVPCPHCGWCYIGF